MPTQVLRVLKAVILMFMQIKKKQYMDSYVSSLDLYLMQYLKP